MATKVWCLVLVLLSSVAAAGERDSIARIRTPDNASGTCFAVKTIPGKTFFGTAAHVVQYRESKQQIYSGNSYTIILPSGDSIQGTCVAVEAASDLAIVQTPEVDIPVLEIGAPDEWVGEGGPDYAPPRVPCKWLGFAGGRESATESIGFLSLLKDGYVYTDGVALPGQSGGPMLVKGKVVGVISGGMEWLGKESTQGTWPTRAGSGKRLKEIVEAMK